MDSHSVATTNQTLHNVDNDPKSTINIPPLRSSLMLPPLFVPPYPRRSGYTLHKPLPPILVPPLPIPDDLNLNNNLFSRHYNDRYAASRSTVSSIHRFDPMGHRPGECLRAVTAVLRFNRCIRFNQINRINGLILRQWNLILMGSIWMLRV